MGNSNSSHHPGRSHPTASGGGAAGTAGRQAAALRNIRDIDKPADAARSTAPSSTTDDSARQRAELRGRISSLSSSTSAINAAAPNGGTAVTHPPAADHVAASAILQPQPSLEEFGQPSNSASPDVAADSNTNSVNVSPEPVAHKADHSSASSAGFGSSATDNAPTGARGGNTTPRQRSSSTYVPSSSSTSSSSSLMAMMNNASLNPSSATSASSSNSARDALISTRDARRMHNSASRGDPRHRSHRGAEGEPLHVGVSCDLCQTTPIRGTRFKCEVCTDYDLCSHCFNTFNIELGDHKPEHAMRRVERPSRSNYSSQAEAFIRMLLNAGYSNVRLVNREQDPEYEARYRAFMEESFYNGPKGYPPASVRAIAALPAGTVTAEDVAAEKECQICMETFAAGDTTLTMQCAYKHIYHTDCLKQWLNEHATCPIDRETIETQEEFDAQVKNSQTI